MLGPPYRRLLRSAGVTEDLFLIRDPHGVNVRSCICRAPEGDAYNKPETGEECVISRHVYVGLQRGVYNRSKTGEECVISRHVYVGLPRGTRTISLKQGRSM